MSSIQAPPIYEPIADRESGITPLPWILFFNAVYNGDSGIDWTPTFTNLTTVGTPMITGRVYQIGKTLAYFKAKIVAGTNTSATAGTTYISNFPLTMTGDGACLAVSGLLGSNSGMCDQQTNRIYVPAWTAVTVPLTIVGMVEAN